MLFFKVNFNTISGVSWLFLLNYLEIIFMCYERNNVSPVASALTAGRLEEVWCRKEQLPSFPRFFLQNEQGIKIPK